MPDEIAVTAGRTRPAAPGRRTSRMLLVGLAVTGVGLGLGGLVAARSGASGPRVGFVAARVDRLEGDRGRTQVPVRLSLRRPLRHAVGIVVATVDGTARAADHDYRASTRRFRIPAGSRAAVVPVAVLGDRRPEQYERFTIRIRSVIGAAVGRGTVTVRILNDDVGPIRLGAVRVGEGGVAEFRPRLAFRVARPVVLTASTTDGSAAAPGDFTPTTRTVTVPAGATTAAPIPVATAADPVAEGPERFGLVVRADGAAASARATATIVETGCPTGAPAATPLPAAAPPSPSAPATDGPPATVTGGRSWDLVFHDEFDDRAATARRWSTGMRSGALTLDGNHELEWYSPANSVLTTDDDGGRTISVLRQRVTARPVGGTRYPVGVLSSIYPPARCPQYYDRHHLAPTDASRVPYRFRSGMLNSAKSFGFRYGYVEARVKMPKGFALWPALWLRDWKPWSYEIDALEGFDPDARTLRATYWWGNGSSFSTGGDGGDLGIGADGTPCRGHPPLPATAASGACSLATSVDLSAGYHTVGLNWTPTRYELYLDGVERWTSAPGAAVATDVNHLILNLALGNDAEEFDWTRTAVRPLDARLLTSTLFPKPTVEWDYVRVWQAPGHHDVCTTGSC
ncbi:MAG: glycoside hydrolase family 16 protein [Acidimicrobiia bacterium]